MDESYENLMEIEDDEEYVRAPRWWSPGTLLTSEASAITAFTLAVTGLMGWVGFPVADALVGFSGRPDQVKERIVVGAIVALVVLIGAFWLCQRVLLDDDDGEVSAWPRHLAGASVVIAAIGSALSIVTVIGGLLVGNPDFAGRIGP